MGFFVGFFFGGGDFLSAVLELFLALKVLKVCSFGPPQPTVWAGAQRDLLY